MYIYIFLHYFVIYSISNSFSHIFLLNNLFLWTIKHSLRVPLYFPIVKLILVISPIKFIFKMIKNIRNITQTERRSRRKVTLKAFDVMSVSGFVHIRAECANFIKSKRKALNITYSEEFNSKDSEDTLDKGVNYLAFFYSVKNADNPNENDTY